MIRPLRRSHLILAIALAILLPGAVLLAVAARPAASPPDNAGLSRLAELETSGSSWSVAALGIELRLATDPTGATFAWVRSSGELGAPDPLLYWVAEIPTDSTSLPATAMLLGSIGRRSGAATPIDSIPRAGALVVWSNGHDRVLATARVELAGMAR